MSVFRFEFRGLVSYVPKVEPCANSATQEVLIVLPNLRLPKKFRVQNHEGEKRTIVPPTHVPALVVEQRFVGRFDREEKICEKRPDLIFERRNRRYAVYLFNFENLSIDTVDAPPLELVREPNLERFIERAERWKANDFSPPEDGLEQDLRWVPSLARAGIQDAAVFDRELVLGNDAPSANTGRLIGTVTPKQGTFRTAGLRRGDEDEVLWIPFGPLGASEDEVVFAQAVASGTENIVETPQKYLDLSFTDADDWVEKIRLHQLEDQTPVVARVVNQELEQILNVGDRTTRRTTELGWDVDPVVFYSLSKAWNQIRGEALPLAEFKGIGRAMGCDPIAFEYWSA